MPFLRFKRWQYLTPLAPHVAVCTSRRRYLWKGDQNGATLVDYKSDMDELLNPMGDRQSDYEVAWEKYNVRFDDTGIEIVEDKKETPLTPKETPSTPAARPVGRPKK